MSDKNLANLRILDWNVNGWRPTFENIKLKYGGLEGFLKEYNLDILCLQETKISGDKPLSMACVEGYESFWADSKRLKGQSGVAIYVKEAFSPIKVELDSLDVSYNDQLLNKEGRFLVTDHGDFAVICVYVPNAGGKPERSRLPFKLQFLNCLLEKVSSLEALGKKVILVGDMNITATPEDMHRSFQDHVAYGDQEYTIMQQLSTQLVDSWRHFHKDDYKTFTCWEERTNGRAKNKGARIDYIFCSRDYLDNLQSCEVIDIHPKWSDHASVLAEFKDIPIPDKHDPCRESSKVVYKQKPGIQQFFKKQSKTNGYSKDQSNDMQPDTKKQKVAS